MCLWVFFIFISCSKEEDQDLSAENLNSTDYTEFLKNKDLLTSNFLPAFTSFYGKDRGTSTNRSSSLASEWIHEYDDEGVLVKSYFFELYPYRILKEIIYLEIVEDHKLKYEIKEYSYYGRMFSFTDSYELIFDDNMNILKIGDNIIKELTDQGWISKIDHAPGDIVVYQIGYEYDDQGNILKYLSFDDSGNNYANVNYTYNENGDPLSYHFKDIYGAEISVDYYYRADNTLERLEEEYFRDDDFGTEMYTYTPEERFYKKISEKGDGTKEVVTYSQDAVEVEIFIDEVLQDVYIYEIQEEGYLLKVHRQYLNEVLQKIEYYDAEGELDYTEYYDENGNITDTIYE